MTSSGKIEATNSGGYNWNETGRDDPEKVWPSLITAMLNWFKEVRKNWIKANKKSHESYPLNCRVGIVPNSLVRESLIEFRRIDKELGKNKSRQFIKLVESGYFNIDLAVYRPIHGKKNHL